MCTSVFGCKRHQVSWLYLVAKDSRCHGCTWLQKTQCVLLCRIVSEWLQKTPGAMVICGYKRRPIRWLYQVEEVDHMLLSVVTKDIQSDGCTWLVKDIQSDGCTWLAKDIQSDGCTWLAKDIQSDGCTWLAKDIQSDGCTWLKKVNHMLLSVVANNIQCDSCT